MKVNLEVDDDFLGNIGINKIIKNLCLDTLPTIRQELKCLSF